MTDLKKIAALIEEQNPLQANQLEKVMQMLTPKEINEANRELDFFSKRLNYTESEIVNAYLWFTNKFMEAQVHFKRTGKYPHSSFAEIEDYYSDDSMMRNYVVSLAVTLYTLPQHIKVMRFYKDSFRFAPHLRKGANYLEIGPGHGHLLVTAMENSNYDFYTAVDIAKSAVETTEKYVKYCLPEKTNYKVLCEDFFDFDSSSEKYDAIVMGEVLEHVEEPERFLKKIYDLASDNAYIYISTAVNAPSFDHIYQFNMVEEVEEMFIRCGLSVKDKVYGIAGGVDFEKAIGKKYTIVPAYVLKKA